MSDDVAAIIAAHHETELALSNVRAYGGKIEDYPRSDADPSLAILLATEALVCAIREASLRCERSVNRFMGSDEELAKMREGL